MDFIDKSIPTTKFDVTTVREGRGPNGERYLGPTVRVNARDSQHAEEVAKSLGHQPNEHFSPVKVRER